MANNLPGLPPDHSVQTWIFNVSSDSLAPAHGHSFAAEYRQQTVSKEPWPGQVQTDSIVVSTPPTLLNAVKALALQGRKDNARILVAKGREEQGNKKNTFCIDCSCHGTQACGAAPGAQRAISSFLQGAKPQGPTWPPALLSQQCLPLPSGQHSPQRHGHITGLSPGNRNSLGLVLAGIRLQMRKTFEQGSYETLGQWYLGCKPSPQFNSNSGYLTEKVFVFGIVIYSAKVSSLFWKSVGMNQGPFWLSNPSVCKV